MSSKDEFETSHAESSPLFYNDDVTAGPVPGHRAPSGGQVPQGGGGYPVLPRLLWVFVILLTIFVMKYLIPHFVEEIQYALVRGRQRAEVEIAAEGLEQLSLNELSTAYQLVSKRVGPSVVHINTASAQRVVSPRDEFSNLFGVPPRQYLATGTGSGVIVDEDGYIVTSHHVIQGASEILVSLSDGRPVRGTVVDVDRATDLAVLKIDANNVIAAEWGNSDELEVGALVWAVGSPFGLDRSITAGILSAKNRQVWAKPQQQFLQTDAAVNPGNSGGPLVDAKGRIIGINTAIVGQTYQGISFAIPSSIAREIYLQLKSGKGIQRGWLGVSLEPPSQLAGNQPQLPERQGAVVAHVLPGSPAQRARVQPGDVIIGWDEHHISDAMALIGWVVRTQPGALVEITLLRNGETMKLDVEIGQVPRR